jgi:hypothetical protein
MRSEDYKMENDESPKYMAHVLLVALATSSFSSGVLGSNSVKSRIMATSKSGTKTVKNKSINEY